jgi:hypothetical protein
VRDFGIRPAVNTAVFSLSFAMLSALSAFIFFHMELIFCLPVILIASSMLVIISFPGFFSQKKLYGIIADIILLLFLLVLIG